MINLLPLFVAIPIGTAFVLLVIPRRVAGLPDALANAAIFGLALLSIMTIGRSGVYHIGGWHEPLGIDLRLDGFSSLMLVAVNIVAFIAALYSISYMRQYTSKFRYFSLLLFMVAGMNGVCLSGDLFTVYVFMEVTALASYTLVAFGTEQEELEASFKYMVLGSLASALILLSIGLVYGVTGTLSMTHIAARLTESGMTPPILFAMALLVCGFGLKAAIVPFHAWLPYAHPSAPAPVSAMLSGLVIKALGLYVLARLVFNVFGAPANLLTILQWLGAISMVVGVLMASGQWDMKRLYACSSISQIGYIVLGLGLGTPLGIVGALYHLVNHSVFKSLLFLNAGAVEYSTGTRDLKRLGGLNKSMPVVGATSLVASLSIGGIPPFNGFFSKLIIIVACVAAGHYWLASWAVLVSILTLAVYLKVQRYGFFESAKATVESLRRTPFFMATAMILLAILCIGMSLFVLTGFREPWLIAPAAKALLQGRFVL